MANELLTDWIQTHPTALALSKGTGVTPVNVPKIQSGLGIVPRLPLPSEDSLNKDMNLAIFQNNHNGLTPTQFANNAEGIYNNNYINDNLNSYYGTNNTNYASTNANADNPFYKNWGYKQWGTAAYAGLGLGQLGLGIANYMTQKKVAGKQMRALDQQYANNADLISHRKSHRASIEKAFANNASNFA